MYETSTKVILLYIRNIKTGFRRFIRTLIFAIFSILLREISRYSVAKFREMM
jgi:hypothetical protein